MRKTLVALMALIVTSACGPGTIATVLAAMGIGGAALNVYCATGGSGCSPALVSYANLIITQANEDAVVIESGTATVAQLQAIAANLQQALATGQSLPGLTPKQQQEVAAITSAASEVLVLLAPLIGQAAPIVATAPAPRAAVVAEGAGNGQSLVSKNPAASVPVKWTVTASDRSALAKMRAKTAPAK